MINDIVIKKTDCFKFLGLIIDSGLTWKKHVDYLCTIIGRNIGVINRIKHFVPPQILFSLYDTLVMSYLNYGLLAWGNCTSSNINRLLRLQKRALRIINSTEFNAHTDPLFFKHRTLKIKDIYHHQLGCFMYQSICNTLPSSINSIFTRNFDIHSYFTRQALHFHLPLTRTSFAQKTIKYEGPKLWNSLNESLRSSTNLLTFKRVYKSILLNVYS